jgi:O-antigen/teichoic acid export membrane protein
MSSGGRVLAAVGGQVLSLLVLVIGTRILTELVSGDVFGEVRLALGVAALVGTTVVQPFGQFAMRGYHDAVAAGREWAFQRFARRCNVIAAVGSALAAAALWVAYGAWAGHVSWLLALAIGVYLLGEARWSLERSLLVTTDRQAAASIIEIVAQTLLIGAAVAGVVLIGSHAVEFVGAQAVALLVFGAWLSRPSGGLAGSAATARGGCQQNDSIWRTDSFRFVAPLAVVSIARWVVNLGDRYLLDYAHGPRVVGHYSAVYGLLATPLMACSAIVARLLYSRWFEREARGERDHDLFAGMLACAATIVGIALAATWVAGDLIVSVALAPEYRPQAGELMLWIVAGYGLLVVAAPFEMRAYARRTTWVLGVGWAAAALVNIGLNLVWIPMWGPVGAARATLASFAVYLAVVGWGIGVRPVWVAGDGEAGT